tara:strand:- start:134 stop:1027 length:894 start_codon:yes stop_codon:yes gene_type:complete
MNIYDCFQYFDEDMLLDLRLNVLDQYIDKFIITESTYMHSGKPKKLNFDIKKFSKFKNKIVYQVVDREPPNLEKINDDDTEENKGNKLIYNGINRDNFQRDMAKTLLKDLHDDDLVLINDIDEIPNMKNINFNNFSNKLIIFKQKTYYYKFNLLYENLIWHGSRACKKKFLISPQWLRNIKHKKYPMWRLDTYFSKKKYKNIYYVEDGGWHFTNIKSAEDLEKKFLNYAHHQDYEASGLNLENIKEKIKNRKILYDLGIDRRGFKWAGEKNLNKVPLTEMPDYLSDNSKKYKEWLDS